MNAWLNKVDKKYHRILRGISYSEISHSETLLQFISDGNTIIFILANLPAVLVFLMKMNLYLVLTNTVQAADKGALFLSTLLYPSTDDSINHALKSPWRLPILGGYLYITDGFTS